MIRLRTLTFGLAVALATGGCVWLFAQGIGGLQQAGTGLPLIKADPTPIKLPPDDPGGNIIPNADSTVFTAMGTKTQADPSMQNVTPPDEPQTKEPVDFAGFRTHFSLPPTPPQKTESLFATPEPTAEPEPALKAEPAPEPTPTPIAEPEPEAKAEPAPEAAPTSKAAPIAPPPSKPQAPAAKDTPKPAAKTPTPTPKAPKATLKQAAPNNYYIQLASARAGANTNAIWQNLQSSYPKALRGLAPVYESVSLQGKGNYIRIQAGPFSKDEAKQRCAHLHSINPKGGCFVTQH